MHKDAPLAHAASVAAGEQGKFWEFHDKVFAGQPKVQRDALLQHARDLGLDMARFEQDMAGPRAKAAIDADIAEAKSLGVTGTPAFFVNGKFVSGAKPFEEFARMINAELTKKGIPIPEEARAAGI